MRLFRASRTTGKVLLSACQRPASQDTAPRIGAGAKVRRFGRMPCLAVLAVGLTAITIAVRVTLMTVGDFSEVIGSDGFDSIRGADSSIVYGLGGRLLLIAHGVFPSKLLC